jgi:hypothetical protein
MQNCRPRSLRLRIFRQFHPKEGILVKIASSRYSPLEAETKSHWLELCAEAAIL